MSDLTIFVLGFAAFAYFLDPPISEYFANRRYARERKRFQKEIDEGKSPDWCPRHIDYNGRVSVHPRDLLRTATVKRTLAEFDVLFKKIDTEQQARGLPPIQSYNGID